ncbi:MAG: T9SS type A sorting domain-containing protein [Bacteroidetes bacterium]|nr:T9SS type A sorting domain-containing protein [Bacteroidota bacterium]
MKKITLQKVIGSLFALTMLMQAQQLNLPKRADDALSGSAFVQKIYSLSVTARENTIFTEIMSGNVPNFLRNLVTISTSSTIGGKNYTLQYYVIPDYMCVGSDSDYFLCPMTPLLAQKLANALQCTLPTWKMVDQIYSAAPVKLAPQPMAYDDSMVTVPRFKQHSDQVRASRNKVLAQYPLGSLVGGTKKDVIIDKKIYSWLKKNVPNPVVIYGWHQLNGTPIQSTYNGHIETYADYSHGIRLVLREGKINGADISLIDLVQDPTYYKILADTILVKPYYHSLTEVNSSETMLPKNFELKQNYPNPFNPQTTIEYSLNEQSFITLKLFDTIGREVATVLQQEKSAGKHVVQLSAGNYHLSTGIYFYRLSGPSFSETKKMIVLQ